MNRPGNVDRYHVILCELVTLHFSEVDRYEINFYQLVTLHF